MITFLRHTTAGVVVMSGLFMGSAYASETLYGVTSSNLITVNEDSPADVTAVGNLGLPAGVEVSPALAYHPGMNRFYALCHEGPSDDRDYLLYEIDPFTGAAGSVGFIMNSGVTGYVEGLVYDGNLDALVIAHSDGGPNDFISDRYEIISTSDASLTFLSSSNLDTDRLAYDLVQGIAYSADPNDTGGGPPGWSRLDLLTGISTFAGPSPLELGAIAADGLGQRILGVNVNSNELLQFDIGSGGLSVSSATSLGVMGGDPVVGLAFGPEATIGVPYCQANANSVSATGATMGASGSASVLANDLVLTCAPIAPSQPGIFFYSPAQTANPSGFPFGEGRQCVLGPIVRLLPPNVADGSGTLSKAVDNTHPVQGAGIVSGMSQNFQGWYRDPAAGDIDGDGVDEGFNLSNGLSVTFEP